MSPLHLFIRNFKTAMTLAAVIAATSALTPQSASAGTQVGLFYNPGLTMPGSGGGTGGLSLMGFGTSLFIGGRVGLETGVSYRSMLVGGNQGPNLVVPLLFRAWLGKVVGLGLGGFFSYKMSSLAAGQTATNYGLKADLGFYIPAGKVRLVIGGGYGFGLARVYNNAAISHADFKVGIQFGEGPK